MDKGLEQNFDYHYVCIKDKEDNRNSFMLFCSVTTSDLKEVQSKLIEVNKKRIRYDIVTFNNKYIAYRNKKLCIYDLYKL